MTVLTKKNHTVAQSALVAILNKHQEVEALKKQYETQKAVLEAQEEQIIRAIEDGHKVADGQRTASIKTVTRRVVAWKQEFINRIGKAVADRLTAEVEPTVYKKLEIA